MLKKGTMLKGFILATVLAIPVSVSANTESIVKDTYSIHLKYPDSVSSSGGTEPTDVNTILDMVRNPGKYPQRSGWGATIYQCNADGTGWEVYEDMKYQTQATNMSYSPTQLKSEIVKKYGNQYYEAIKDSGMEIVYDASTPIPEKYLPPKQGLGDTGVHVIYHKSTIDNNNCKADSLGYVYTNYDFYVSGTVEVPWKEPQDGEGGLTGEVYWELSREDSHKASDVTASMELTADTTRHVAVKDLESTLGIGSKNLIKDGGGKIELTESSKYLKNTHINYSVGYNYTNKEIGWVCSGEGDTHKCTYNSNPDWRVEKPYKKHSTMALDYSLGGVNRVEDIDKLGTLQWKVGEKHVWEGQTKSAKNYYEKLEKQEGNKILPKHELYTQTHIPMAPGKYVYSVELPSGKHKDPNYRGYNSNGSGGYYYSDKLDENLREQYKYR